MEKTEIIHYGNSLHGVDKWMMNENIKIKNEKTATKKLKPN